MYNNRIHLYTYVHMALIMHYTNIIVVVTLLYKITVNWCVEWCNTMNIFNY